MNCLCCGKIITDESKASHGWHTSCIKKFFGTSIMPSFDFSEETIRRIAEDNIAKGYTVPGVQKKLSLHLTAEAVPRLTMVNYPAGYILKPQTEAFTALPESEFLVMQMAKETGINTVPFALINVSGEYAYLTKRIDRILPTKRRPETQTLSMEDFCQLDYRQTADKYRGSYERCGKIIERYSQNPGFDMSELFLRIVFSFITGNSDMHLKNFSLIEISPTSQTYSLSAAYDLLPVNIIMPEDTDQMALALNGKKRNLHRNDFLKLAASCNIPDLAARNIIKKIVSLADKYIEMCGNSYLPEKEKEAFAALIENRKNALE